MTDAEKWATFVEQVDWKAWAATPDGVGGQLLQLPDDWRKALFDSSCAALMANADAQLTTYNAVAFLDRDGVYDVQVASRARPTQSYGFKWVFGPPIATTYDDVKPCGSTTQRVICVRLGANEEGPSANVVWLIAPDQIASPTLPQNMNMRIFCAELDETIDLNLHSLAMRYHESLRQQHQRILAQQATTDAQIMPWRVLLLWMWRLKTVDRVAYGRIVAPIRAVLDVQNEWWCGQLTFQQLAPWQHHGWLPPELPQIEPDDVDALKGSIEMQQNLAVQDDVMLMFNYLSPFPPLVLTLTPQALTAFDLQAFMAIGALREVHGFLESQMKDLMRTDPKIRMMMNSPQGKAQVLQDPRCVKLRSNPRVMKEIEEEQVVAARHQGNYGPSARQSLRAVRNQQEEMATMNTTMFLGGGPLMGLAALMSTQSAQSGCPPAQGSAPWKLYEPYLI